MANVVDNFFGCYLLVSANSKYKGWTYIGFTVDPNRRCTQHNIGREKGGAWRTSGKGPWDMVLIIHGFPSKIAALQFEWAWQHPTKSTKLKGVCTRHSKLKGFKYRFHIVCEMLRVGPWNRLPLTIRWLNQDFVTEFPANLQPPTHMAIAYGPVKCSKISKSNQVKENRDSEDVVCTFCTEIIKNPDALLRCLSADCSMSAHMVCLAEDFLSQEKVADMLLPVAGDCKLCKRNLLWGHLIKHKQGHLLDPDNQKGTNVESVEDTDGEDTTHWSEALSQV